MVCTPPCWLSSDSSRGTDNTCNHYENLPMQYTEIFSPVKIQNFYGIIFDTCIFLIFAQNVDCGYTLVQSYEYT